MVQDLKPAIAKLFMRFLYATLFIFLFAQSKLVAQQTDSSKNNVGNDKEHLTSAPVFRIKPGLEIPLTLAFDAWSIYGMSVIYGRDAVPVSEILQLDKKKVNKFDRPITNNYSIKAKELSDKFFYGSMPLPLILLADKKIRKDGFKIGLLYLETMGATGVIYTSSAMIANRFRPYAYNNDLSMDTRTRGGTRNSFFAGHPAVVASSTFFMAKVYAAYHPDMKNKWILYALAGSATATTGILRLKAGQHFKTDVITGVTIGTLAGILVPHFHQQHHSTSSRLVIVPDFGSQGSSFTAFYKLGK